MSKVIVFISVFIAIQSVFWLVMTRIEVKSLKFDKELLEKRIENLRDSLRIQRNIYQADVERLRNLTYNKKPTEIPKGTIEAVRYAMIHNHPDNGGDAKKFILYKNCYDKLTGGR